MATDFNSIIRTVAKTPDGAKTFNYILTTMCAVNDANYNTDTIQMARQEGRRSVGLDLKVVLGDDLYFAILSTKVS